MAGVTYDKASRIYPGATRPAVDALDLEIADGEFMTVVDAGAGLATEVEVVEELGAAAYVYGSAEVAGERHSVIARVGGRTPPSKGAVLHLAPSPERLHLFAGDTGERIEL